MDNTNNFNRVCSFCGESIAAEYKRCPYCGSLLGVDKAHSGADINLGNENSIYKGERSIWSETGSIQKNTSNVLENESNIPKNESNVWEGTSNIPKDPGYVREDERGFAKKAVSAQENINYGTAAGYEIRKTAANEGVYKNNTITHSKKSALQIGFHQWGTVLRFSWLHYQIFCRIGQLIGVIAGIVFMNAGEDEDKQSFGKAILISSMIVFLL